MDLDIEMDDAVQEPLMEEQILNSTADDILQPDEPEELGEVVEDPIVDKSDEARTIVPTKVHIHGLDTMNTDDIKKYVKAHYGDTDRVEWIDDSSANLNFPSESSARDALIALSSIAIADPTALSIGESLVAKPLEGRPEISLRVRYAVFSDKKAPGAAQRSRFYLLNPEYDPEERRRHQQQRRYRDRDHRRNDSGGRRRDSREETGIRFEASMYDDAPKPQRRRSSDSSEHNRPDNRGKELFASGGRSSRRRNDRSLSPRRDNDGDDSMGEGGRASSHGNRAKARSLKERISNDHNRSKELFPTKASGRGGQLDQLESAIGSARLREEDRPRVVDAPSVPRKGADSFNIRGSANQRGEAGQGFSIRGSAANAKELFPSKLGGTNAGKELLEGRKNKPRQRAEDLFG